MRDSLNVGPRDYVPCHREGNLRQEVGMELALAVDRDHIRVLDLEYYTKYCA